VKRLLVVIAFSALLSACVTEVTNPQNQPASPEKQIQTLVDLGVGYIRNGEYGRAKDNLNRALSIDPGSPKVHNAFGLVFQLEGEVALADMHYRKAVNDKTFTRAINNYGAFLYAQGRFREAIDQLKIAGEDQFYQNRPQVYENLGVAYAQLGEIENAEASFFRATQLNPRQGRALLEMAEIRFVQENYVEAQDYYRRHIAASNQSAPSLWLCVRVARVFSNENDEASCSLTLRNIFPASKEAKLLEASQ
jgi:type IV pilus assembly protein PilF